MTSNTLPPQTTSFVGRTTERSEMAALLTDPACRLLTLHGVGGIGKTRLALQVAADLLPHFAHGVYFVPLAPVTSTDQFASAVASAMQITAIGSEDVGTQITRYLREKHILLLLDNFEHLRDAMNLLTDILLAAPNVKILVTSRERLNIHEEWSFPLDGLRFPHADSSEPLADFSAIQLFLQRSRQVQPNFSLLDNAEAVKSICQTVEGMPLGLELAATWLRVMSCEHIAAQMTQNLDFLTTPHHNVPERHRSLRAVFTYSWAILSPAEQSVLARLSIFRGGFDFDAAEQVAGVTLPLLAGLVDKSLVRFSADGRYDLHELLRQFAADTLSLDETTATAQVHFAYFLKLAEQAESHQFGSAQIPWFDRIEVELNNVRQALAWSLQNEDASAGLQLAAALGWFFTERAHWIESLAWFEKLFASNPDVPPSLRAKALHSAGALAGLQGNPRSRALLEEALALARIANDRWNIAWSLSHIGNYLWENPALSAAALDESLDLFRELDDRMGIAHTLIRRSWIIINFQPDLDARPLLDEAHNLAREAGDKVIAAWVHYTLGRISVFQGQDLQQAKSQLEMSESLFRAAHFGFSNERYLLACIELTLGNPARAQALYEECLTIFGKLTQGDDVHALIGLASVATARRQFARAAILFGNTEWFPFPEAKTHPNVFTYDNDIAQVRAQLGEEAFAEAWATGKAMTFDQAVAYALEGRTSLTTAPPDQASSYSLPDSLTPRELEILRLISEGLSNAEVASRLFLTIGTVKVHTSNIYGKLSVNSRTQAIAEAQKLGFL